VTRAAIYCRISRDGDGRGLGVERQRDDCLDLARILGLTVDPADIVEENDPTANGKATSASASVYANKPRPKFDRLVERVRAGEVTHVLSYSMSRLTRDMIEREGLLSLRHAGATITTTQATRIYPGMSSNEVDMVRMMGVRDTGESDLISERTKRKFDQNAAAGTPHGPIAYGWTRHHEPNGTVVDTIDEAQAGVIREAARRMLAGETTYGIAFDLTQRKIPAPRGGAWSPTILSKIMLRERNAARRVHRGVVVGPAAWSPIYDDATHDAVVAHLHDPERGPRRRAARRHLLSGVLVCGNCGSSRVWVMHPGKNTRGSQAYACKDCNANRRRQDHVDEYVVEAVCARMARPDALDWCAADAGALDAARDRLTALRGQGDMFVDMLQAVPAQMTREQFVRANMRLQADIAEAENDVERARPVPSAVRTMIGHGSVEATRAVWDGLTLDQQRDIVRTLAVVTLVKTGDRKFTPACVRFDWRTEVADVAA
jgi:site-specific DNA recombinase